MTSNLFQTGWKRAMAWASLRRTPCTIRARIRKSTALHLEELGPRLLPSVTPIGIEATSGGGQSIGVNATFTNALRATVGNLDTGRPAAEVYVVFTAPASGASGTFSNGSTTIGGITDSDGHVWESFTANALPGSYSVTAKISGTILSRSFALTNNEGGAQPSSSVLTPQQVQDAYGFNSVPAFKVGNQSFTANGQGQTIAVLDPGSDPNVARDLQTFSAQFKLLQLDGENGDPTFTTLDENGGNQLPSQSNQVTEIDLDVEWAHAIAPGANIVLVEINSFANADVENGLATAYKAGASVVSMSFLLAHDLEQAPPAGVTYVSAAGDADGNYFGSVNGKFTFTSGAGSQDLIVGGTMFPAGTPLTSSNPYPGEYVWQQPGTTWQVGDANNVTHSYSAGTTYGTYHNVLDGSGNANSVPLPSWQAAAAADVGQQTGTTPTNRMVPDVSMVATNLVVADATDNGAATPWGSVWGTSVATPMWAGLLAIANEGRQVQGFSRLNSADDPLLPAVYNLPSFDFNHVVANPNSSYVPNTSAPYDEATGLGTPKANLIIPALAAPDGQLPNGQLTIEGNLAGSDTITVNVAKVTLPFIGITLPVVQVQVNNLTSNFLVGEVKSIVVNALAPTDTVNINATPAGVPLTIDLGSGTTTVNLAGLGGPTGSGLGGPATVIGGTGTGALNVNDPTLGSAVMTSYYVTDWSIQRNTGNAVRFEGLSQVTLHGVSLATTNGLVYYYIGRTLTGLAPGLTNPVGAATLNVDGSGNVGRNEFSIGSSHNFFAAVQTLNVSTGQGGENTVAVNALPRGVALNIGSAGATNDSIYVGDGSFSLAGIQGALNISYGSAGQARVVVDGSDDPSANYELANGALSVSNGPTISYQGSDDGVGVSSLEVIEGGAQDTFDAESIAGQTSVSLQNLFNDAPTVTGAAAGSVQVN
jgi:hypothetical protein